MGKNQLTKCNPVFGEGDKKIIFTYIYNATLIQHESINDFINFRNESFYEKAQNNNKERSFWE